MPGTMYALLVGIDTYQRPVPALHGCVNDIEAVKQLLDHRVASDKVRLELDSLRNEEATRQVVIDRFRSHLGRAKDGDIALFYFSGHGSQEDAPPEFWRFEPDRLDETLVCYDSRTPDSYDLADKELGQLIAEVARRGPHVVVILDCCHSGSGTRATLEGGVAIRRAPTDHRQRPLTSFIVAPEDVESATRSATEEASSGWVDLARGRHVLLAACRADETAKEVPAGGRVRGAMSTALESALEQAGGQLTYRDLHQWVRAQVRNKVTEQTPQLECTDPEDYERTFLGGAVLPRADYYTLSFDAAEGWVVDAGAVHGMPPVEGDETTRLAIYGLDTGPAQWRDLASALATGAVTAVLPDHSLVDLEVPAGHPALDPSRTYKAVVTATPLPPLEVALEGTPEGVASVRRALDKAGPGGTPSVLVRERQGTAEFQVIALPDRLRISRAGAERPIIDDITEPGEAAAIRVVQRLEHIAAWTRLGDLHNPTSRLREGELRLEIFQVERKEEEPGKPLPPGAVRVRYRRDAGGWRQPMLKIRVTNRSSQRLYCALFDLTEEYAIEHALLGRGGEWLEPGASAWANEGEPIYPAVPKALWQQGVTEFSDILKLVASTHEFDSSRARQPRLDVGFTRSLAGADRQRPRSTLERMFQRVQTRTLGTTPEEDEVVADWTAMQLDVVTVRPLDAISVSRDAEVELATGVALLPHPALSASAQLTTAPEVTRDLAVPPLPALLRDDPDVSEPYPFTSARGTDPGLSALELRDLANWEAVTPAQPLVVRVERSLDEDEHVLPLAWDGQFYLPLGWARRGPGASTEVVLEQLVAPVATARDLRGSIRILFRKVVGRRFGLGYDYPLLTMATMVDGSVHYEHDRADIRAAVDGASRILLYVHGIIGDTRGMVSSAQPAQLAPAAPVPGVGDRYDLLLAFDYENLNTPIPETARRLKDRLADVGLGEGHAKTLDIVAHSMGGLVSRWMIERESGDAVVSRLVTLGTPHAGSPWSVLQNWATTIMTLGLNGLATVAWPARILSALIVAAEKVDVTLDQMAPDSQFLVDLLAAPDPHLPYQVIVGNRSLLQGARGEPNGVLERLLARLSPARALDSAIALAFLRQPNDLAVSVASAQHLPAGRDPAPEIHEIACDHITFFSTAAGLTALAEALAVTPAGAGDLRGPTEGR